MKKIVKAGAIMTGALVTGTIAGWALDKAGAGAPIAVGTIAAVCAGIHSYNRNNRRKKLQLECE